jgi:hypothetical protein
MARDQEKIPYVVKEVPPHLRTNRPTHRLIKEDDGVFHIHKEDQIAEGRQFDVFMRSGSMVRFTEKEFQTFEHQYNPKTTPEEDLMRVFVETEYVKKEG